MRLSVQSRIQFRVSEPLLNHFSVHSRFSATQCENVSEGMERQFREPTHLRHCFEFCEFAVRPMNQKIRELSYIAPAE